jgi:F0F1-type ATP synthase assembly protein I
VEGEETKVSGATLIGFFLLLFFLAGIGAGIAAVIAISARRTRKPSEHGGPDGEDDEQG